MQYNVNIKRGICGLVEYSFLLRKCLRKHKGRIRFVANNSQSLQNRNVSQAITQKYKDKY